MRLICLLTVVAVIMFGASAFAQNLGVTNASSSGSRATGVEGNVQQGQSLTFAPSSRGSKRTIFPPNQGGLANPGVLFVDPGQGINKQVSEIQNQFRRFCGGGRIPVSMLDNPRYQRIVEDAGESGIRASFQPHQHYVTGAFQTFHASVTSVEMKSDLPAGHKYYCAGMIYLVTENNEDVAEYVDTDALFNRAKRFAAKNLNGYTNFILLAKNAGIAFEREITGEGSGFSLGPQISGFLGNTLLGLPGNFSRSGTKTGAFDRPGAMIPVFVHAPIHAENAIMVEESKQPPPQRQSTVREPSPANSAQVPTQRVVVEIKVPSQD